MLFNEQSFIFIFLPVVLAGLFAFKALAPRLTCVWVVVSSFFFYGFHAWEHLPLLTGSVILNFGLAQEFRSPKNPKLSLTLCLWEFLVTLGVLAVFKYSDFFLLQLGYDEGFGLLLPLAISFLLFSKSPISWTWGEENLQTLVSCIIVCSFHFFLSSLRVQSYVVRRLSPS